MIPQNFLNLLMNGSNPKNMVLGMLKNASSDYPMLGNVANLANGNNASNIEQIARNLCKSKGIDADKAYQEIMSDIQSYKR